MSALTFSLVALWAVALLQGLAVMAALRQVVAIKTVLWERNQRRRRNQLPYGAPIPPFSVESLGAATPFGNDHLRGQPSMLLFATAGDPASPTYRYLPSLVRPLGERAGGPVYVVCTGDRGACQQLAKATGIPVPVLVDPEGHLARLFKISSDLEAIHLDDETRVVSYGEPQQPNAPGGPESSGDPSMDNSS